MKQYKSGELLKRDFSAMNFQNTEYLSKVFENIMSNIRVVKNGVFFDSNYLLPTFGYEAYNEIMDASDRKERGSKPRKLIPKLDKKDKAYLKENYITGKIRAF